MYHKRAIMAPGQLARQSTVLVEGEINTTHTLTSVKGETRHCIWTMVIH